jgi:hypothetical protein
MEKGFYWVAVGLLVLGVNQSVLNRRGDWLSSVETGSVARVAQLSHQAWDRLQGGNSSYDQVGELPGLNQLDQLDRLDSMRIARAAHNADFAQRRAEWVQRRIETANRIEGSRAEWMAQRRMQAFVPCPGQNIRVNVPPIQVPAVHVTVFGDEGTI